MAMTEPAPAGTAAMRRLTPDLTAALAAFFEDLTAAGDTRQFHPHPMTFDEAKRRCEHTGRDFYGAMVQDGNVVAYGMLRGWDAGFEVPSLGLAVHPAARGRGLGRTMMDWLHDVARREGAARVRLKVYPDNAPARELYESLGYVFGESEGGQLVGVKQLN